MNFLTYFLDSVKILFSGSLNVPSSAELRLREKQNALRVCSYLSRGNISLKNGKFMTTDDLKRRREANLKHQFSQ